MTALVVAEFRKVLGLRFWWILGIAPIVVGLFCGAMTLPLLTGLDDFFGEGAGRVFAAAIGIAFSLLLVFLFAALFGVVDTGNEFQHRTALTTFLTARGRDRVVAAKFATTAVFGLAYCIVVEIASALTILMFGGGFGNVDGGAVFAVLATGAMCAVLWALIGAGLGLLTGSTTVGVLVLCAWIPFGELVVSLVLHGLGAEAVAEFLPGQVTVSTMFTVIGPDDDDAVSTMAWPLAPLVLVAWTVALCGLGWWRTRTRDIL